MARELKTKKRHGALIYLGLALACLLSACSEFRGIPTHGGGKRFDEEERVVAGAIRRALADMDLKELRGRNALIVVECISNNGGGVVTFPGLQTFYVNGGRSKADNAIFYDQSEFHSPPGVWSSFYPNNNSSNRLTSLNANVNGSFAPAYNATTLGSEADMLYLRAALNMKLHHSGIGIAPTNPDSVLYVLVDVLGTNRSRRDNFVYWKDTLRASCELTYYAQDARSTTNTLLFRARRTSAAGFYEERSWLGFTAYRVDRAVQSTMPSFLPTDGAEVAVAVTPDEHAGLLTNPLAALGSLWPAPGVETQPTTVTMDQSMKQYLDAQVMNARMQIQRNNPAQAQQIIDTVRAAQPGYPGLTELEADLQRQRSQPRPAMPAMPTVPQPLPSPVK